MTDRRVQGVLDRKVSGAKARAGTEPRDVLRVALGRGARDGAGLALAVDDIAQARDSLAELLERLPEHALVVMVEGPGEALGVAVLDPCVTSALIEAQTTGHVAAETPAPRRPTRVDAAICAATIDRILAWFDTGIADGPELARLGGYRYASFLDTPHALPFLLEDVAYRSFIAQVSMADGQRRGAVLLCLPLRVAAAPADAAAPAAPGLAAAVQSAHVTLNAVLHRRRMALAAVRALKPGDLLTVPMDALDSVALEGVDGRTAARARLGQTRGHRALRLHASDRQPETPAVGPAHLAGAARKGAPALSAQAAAPGGGAAPDIAAPGAVPEGEKDGAADEGDEDGAAPARPQAATPAS